MVPFLCLKIKCKEDESVKKRGIVWLLLCVMLLSSLTGCVQKGGTEVDYSEYAFTDVNWTREGDCDVERLRFLSDGGFQYFCACGNPVNDADVVESYTYDDTTKTFTLHCLEEIDGMVTKIALIDCDGDTLELDFDGEVRIFVREGLQLQGNAQKFNVDLRKVNLIVEELADPAVVQAARNVVDAFLLYEDEVVIEVNGNTQRFVTDMMYIVHCTCPMFEAFADFNEMTAYDVDTGTVFHTGGQGVHMWNFVLIDGKYYYCDPTFDIEGVFDYFGMTAEDRAGWAGGYSADDGTMLGAVIPDKYEITDARFEILRTKMPVELTDIEVDHEKQTITFFGHGYEYTFECK